MTVQDLPTLNACLNSTALVLLLSGFAAIRRGRKDVHRLCMVSAFIVSTLFLVSYLYYHAHVLHTPFTGQGWIRPLYFFILITHILLAALVPFLALITLYRAVKGQFEKHKAIARWTFPIWVYVSVTGVAVYVILYRLYPAAP
jgi:uncharacterized membrane protein YozB (DUF420 family)